MNIQLSQNLDVLGKFQVQNRNQQFKIYEKLLSLPRGKKNVGLYNYKHLIFYLHGIYEYSIDDKKKYFLEENLLKEDV
jgi:hypothetical protein